MTKKHQLLAALTVSTVALTQAGLASADEVSSPETLNEVSVVTETQPIDPSTPIVPPAPTDPTKPPTLPTNPDVPANPGTGGDTTTPPTTPDVPAGPGAGGDTTTPPTTPDVPAGPGTGGDTTKPSKPSQPSTPDVPNNPGAGEETTKPSEPSQPTTPTPPITDDAVNKDDQGNITVKPQVVAPNQTVVGTQNGQLLVQDASGNTRLAEATEFGGQKNDNGTVSFKTADGKTVTLPETGSTSGTLLSLLGSGLLGLFGFFWKKKQL